MSVRKWAVLGVILIPLALILANHSSHVAIGVAIGGLVGFLKDDQDG